MAEVIHLKTQRNQPYGSERRCCEKCGVMIWGGDAPTFTEDPDLYEHPPKKFVPCNMQEA